MPLVNYRFYILNRHDHITRLHVAECDGAESIEAHSPRITRQRGRGSGRGGLGEGPPRLPGRARQGRFIALGMWFRRADAEQLRQKARRFRSMVLDEDDTPISERLLLIA